ncbi:MAG: DUF2178 domain-containing protein [Dehalococcoidia bacterium]
MVFVIKGDITAFGEDDNLRYLTYGVLIGVPLIYLILVNVTLRKPTQIDERDRRIMDKAPRLQLGAIYISLAVWAIALTEVYRDTGQIPYIFITLILFSTIIISSLAQSLGILIGYWRTDRDG